ncbi:hypothetical protein BT69DRAFT_1011189 [Atractiella rhizophila]|nr:hypothetical protein BT69DRAFT_1011189 [Atractiella rhizophila]
MDSPPPITVSRGDFTYGPNPSEGLLISGVPRCEPEELLSLIQKEMASQPLALLHKETSASSPFPSRRSNSPGPKSNPSAFLPKSPSKTSPTRRDFWAAQCVFYNLPILYGNEAQLVHNLWKEVNENGGLKFSLQLQLLEEDLAREWKRLMVDQARS